MELKSQSEWCRDSELRCSNCTFMELKYNISDANLAAIVSSNCTFMELKSRCCVTQSAVSQF